MAYKDKVLDHFENPRNVGSLDKDAPDVGTGLVGAPACGDVMRLQVRIEEKIVGARCTTCGGLTPLDGVPPAAFALACGHELFVLERRDVIADAKFKTFGCGSAIASSSLVTEWVKGMTADQALALTNAQIAEELTLPPVKIHCSVLAEDAVKAAIADFRAKRAARRPLSGADRSETPPPPPADATEAAAVREEAASIPAAPRTPSRVPLPAEWPATPVAEDGHARPDRYGDDDDC